VATSDWRWERLEGEENLFTFTLRHWSGAIEAALFNAASMELALQYQTPPDAGEWGIWRDEMYAGSPSLALARSIDQHSLPIGWLCRRDSAFWHKVAREQLPALIGGGVRFDFPPLPLTLPHPPGHPPPFLDA
jgi:hypothetical protein